MTAGRKVEHNAWPYPLSTNTVPSGTTPSHDGGIAVAAWR